MSSSTLLVSSLLVGLGLLTWLVVAIWKGRRYRTSAPSRRAMEELLSTKRVKKDEGTFL